MPRGASGFRLRTRGMDAPVAPVTCSPENYPLGLFLSRREGAGAPPWCGWALGEPGGLDGTHGARSAAGERRAIPERSSLVGTE